MEEKVGNSCGWNEVEWKGKEKREKKLWMEES